MCYLKKTFYFLTTFFIIALPAFGANQVVDTNQSPRTFIDQTANGIDLINISNPSAGGVSVNHFNRFDVSNRGAILNNSTVTGHSQLGGAVQLNPNLNHSADIILNQVGYSGTRSQLNGALEVFG
jgi:filamentous hemagglutinin